MKLLFLIIIMFFPLAFWVLFSKECTLYTCLSEMDYAQVAYESSGLQEKGDVYIYYFYYFPGGLYIFSHIM